MENNCEIKIIEIKCNCEDEKLAELVQSVVHDYISEKSTNNEETDGIVLPKTVRVE
mgnify:FL=1